MKQCLHILRFFLIHLFSLSAFAQNFQDSIQEKDASTILHFLSSDQLKGRGNFTPELVKAADFIANTFTQNGLKPFPGNFTFFQPFNGVDSRSINRDRLRWNGKNLSQSRFMYITSEILPATKTLNDFKIIEYEGRFTDSILLAHWGDSTNILIWWKQSPSAKGGISSEEMHLPDLPPAKNILFVSETSIPRSLLITTNEEYREKVLFNVIGVLPGKTKPNEIIVFSAHYDHLGGSGREIYHGANDDASGTTAVLMLAKYFVLRNDNERTIVFCAFAGEELGLFGSYYFASTVKAENVTAVINIEMIGKTYLNGKNLFCVTGAAYSNLSQILKSNLKNNVVRLATGCYVRDLFERSDNYPFALKGIPAHTIMCSNDSDPCYHKPCDVFETIDIKNMTIIIRAIAEGSQSIIDGKDTPSRLNMMELK